MSFWEFYNVHEFLGTGVVVGVMFLLGYTVDTVSNSVVKAAASRRPRIRLSGTQEGGGE